MPADSPLSRQQLKLIGTAADIALDPVPTDLDRAFMARQLVQATLPHANPGNVPAWSRTNGNLTLTIQPGWDHKRKKPFGYPYGTLPRLLLFWMITEAIRTGVPRLELGRSLAAFMRALGLDPGRGGPRSDAYRLREQMQRLFRARISFDQPVTDNGRTGDAWLDMQVAPQGVLWWDHRGDPTQEALFGSWIELSLPFFEAIKSAPVPVDLRALKALRKSPLALDLYAWTTYTAYVATQRGRVRFVSWENLKQQFGAGYKTTNDFQKKAAAALRKIKAVYPGLKLGKARGGVEILPGASAVPSRPRSPRKPRQIQS